MTWLKGLCVFTGRKHWVLKDYNLAEKSVIKTNGWKLKPDKFKLEVRHIFCNTKDNYPLEERNERHAGFSSWSLQVSTGFLSRSSGLASYNWRTWIREKWAEIHWLRAVLFPEKPVHPHLHKWGIKFQWEKLKDQRLNGTLGITLKKLALLILLRDNTWCFVKG